ncbi:MAG: TlpA family protein disulfide reductase [Actinomycetota bacterium]
MNANSPPNDHLRGGKRGRGTSRRRPWWFYGGLAVLVLLGGFIANAAREQVGKSEQAGGISVADYQARARVDDRPAPPFELEALDGNRTISLSDFAGDVVVLNFWASWCGPCRVEAPGLQRVWEAYRDRGVQFLGVDYRDDRFAARAFQDEFGITFPSVFDPAGELAFDYGLFGLPSTFIINREGRIVFHYTGIVTESLLHDSLDEVLAENPT